MRYSQAAVMPGATEVLAYGMGVTPKKYLALAKSNLISSHLKSFIELLNLNGKNLTSHALKTLFYYYRLRRNNYEKFR
jgi:hypothetical protein